MDSSWVNAPRGARLRTVLWGRVKSSGGVVLSNVDYLLRCPFVPNYYLFSPYQKGAF